MMHRQQHTNPLRFGLGLFLLGLGLTLVSGCGGIPRNLLDKDRPLQPRPTHFGLSLPHPFYLTEHIPDSLLAVPRVRPPLLVNIVVDSVGLVSSVTPSDPNMDEALAPYEPYIRTARFEPGLRDTLPASLPIQIRLQFDPTDGSPQIAFPVDPDRGVTASDLYWQSFALNGIESPGWEYFPSYYFKFDASTNYSTYPFLILQLDLDATGDLVSARRVAGITGPYADQIRTAAHWGRYRPFALDGQSQAAPCFLAVGLFPSADYPTLPLDWSDSTFAHDSERFRLKLSLDTVGLMMPPIPTLNWSGHITDEFFKLESDTIITGRLLVDSVGIVRQVLLDTDIWRARNYVSQKARDIKFLPARDYGGKPHSATGTLYMQYSDESNVRIRFDWDGFTTH